MQSAIAEFVSQPVQSGVDESGDDAGYKHLMLEALNDAGITVVYTTPVLLISLK